MSESTGERINSDLQGNRAKHVFLVRDREAKKEGKESEVESYLSFGMVADDGSDVFWTVAFASDILAHLDIVRAVAKHYKLKEETLLSAIRNAVKSRRAPLDDEAKQTSEDKEEDQPSDLAKLTGYAHGILRWSRETTNLRRARRH